MTQSEPKFWILWVLSQVRVFVNIYIYIYIFENFREDLPSVNVQEVILVIPTPTVSEILVVLIHVVSIEYLKTKVFG